MSVIDRDDPFLGRSILDLEGLRVRAEDELAAVEQAIPGVTRCSRDAGIPRPGD